MSQNESRRRRTEEGALEANNEKAEGGSGTTEGERLQAKSLSSTEALATSEQENNFAEQTHHSSDEKQRIFNESSSYKTKITRNENVSLSNENKGLLESLSLDILAWLLSYLAVPEIAAASLASKRINRACRSNDLWKLKFQGRWNLPSSENPGQNWYLAYQEAYRNPHDLWIFHWNCVYPQDGLVPGRCCIYDAPKRAPVEHGNRHKACPKCRFFPEHPLNTCFSDSECTEEDKESNSATKDIMQATDKILKDFYKQYVLSTESAETYERQKAEIAFSDAATFHRTLDTQQYTATHPQHESNTTYLSPLKDLLFFNVTEEPLSTKQGARELEHLRRERELQQQWEAEQNPRSRRKSDVFWKPGFETAHHTWHQALVTNPDFARPIVFRISVQRPDCFTVFPSEGYLEPGHTIVITFGVRPLGSLLATLFETINVQRTDTEDWMKRAWSEEGPLPVAPFVIRYKYSSVLPCIPARGFIPPHLPQPRRHEDILVHSANEDDNDAAEDSTANKFPSVADVCWQQKQLIDYHWSGGDPKAMVESHEVRNIYLSAHINADFPFSQFCHDTLTPFDISIDASTNEIATPMLYYAAPQLHEFYTASVFPLLQHVKLEQEVTHAGQVFRSHRQKCIRCLRFSWGPRLEEIGQAYVRARLGSYVMVTRQKNMFRNCELIVRCADAVLKQSLSENDAEIPSNDDDEANMLIYVQQLLYVVYNNLQRYRAAPYLGREQRQLFMNLESLADYLYGECSDRIQSSGSKWPWRQSGIYLHRRCTDSIFNHEESIVEHEEERPLHAIKAEPKSLNSFRFLAQTPGRYNLGPQEDPNHLGELIPSANIPNRYRRRQAGVVTDMFMDNPVCSLQSALIMLHDPRSISLHGIYDRIAYPGKVVRRPRFPLWFTDPQCLKSKVYNDCDDVTNLSGKGAYCLLQDTMDLEALVPQSLITPLQPFSLRRYLRNVPPLGMGRFPLSIDEGAYAASSALTTTERQVQDANSNSAVKAMLIAGPEINNNLRLNSASSRIVALPLPKPFDEKVDFRCGTASDAPPLTRRRQSDMSAGHRGNGPPPVDNDGHANNLNNMFGGGNLNGAPPLLRGPGPRLLTLLWSVSAQLGWTADDVGHGAASVFLNRQLLIGLQWFSLTLMAGPLFWTLVARNIEWIPCKPVDYQLDDLPYQLTNEMRFLTERECGAAAFLIAIMLVFLGRWTERWTSRGFFRAMLEHVSAKTRTTFTSRVIQRYKRQWDAVCPLFLQRLTYTPEWNRRSFDDLMSHISVWRNSDYREHRSIFPAKLGRGLMFWGGRWEEINVKNPSSRNFLFAVLVALGSFLSSTPNFWMNLLVVFSCSISLGLSMSLSSLETETTGTPRGGASLLKSLNLPSLVIGSFLIGQLLGSSGGVLFLAEFVVTSISFILGGAGTISASSVASWGCFFGLSSTAFWGYLFGRVALIDAIIRQKRRVRNKGHSTFILCASLVVVFILWVLLFVWRWDVPVSLMIVQPSFIKSARSAGTATTENMVARSAARKYAAKHLQ